MTTRQSRFYDRMRDPASLQAARSGATAEGFDALRGRKYCLLVSYRRSGEPVPTPVWFGLHDGGQRLYIRTEAEAGKVKRVRANPQVLVGPSDVRGKPLGPLAAGRARVLASEEHAGAERTVQANYGLARRIYEAVLGARGDGSAYLEVTAA
jgi:PPOX class probable F420-dependent enzyme